MGKKPYMPFFTGDWMKDPAVSICTPATRGVWIDLLSAMHEAGRSGELCGTPEQLARLARCSTADLSLALTDLQTTGAAVVSNRNGVVTVINRRMKRDAEKRDRDLKRQRKHRGIDDPEYGLSRDCHSDVAFEDESGIVFEFPGILRNEEFKVLWFEWIDFRRKKGHSCEPNCLKRQINMLEKIGESAAAFDCLNSSLASGYQGIFPEKFITGPNGKKPSNGKPAPDYKDLTSVASERRAAKEARKSTDGQ